MEDSHDDRSADDVTAGRVVSVAGRESNYPVVGGNEAAPVRIGVRSAVAEDRGQISPAALAVAVPADGEYVLITGESGLLYAFCAVAVVCAAYAVIRLKRAED